jgi:hypothetical protein
MCEMRGDRFANDEPLERAEQSFFRHGWASETRLLVLPRRSAVRREGGSPEMQKAAARCGFHQ